MAISIAGKRVEQPELLPVSEQIRLKKPVPEEWAQALAWYADQEIMYASEGISVGNYGWEEIQQMYTYLGGRGELYFIEALEKQGWRAIGDVALSGENLPIVIGDKAYWGKGVGKQVVAALLSRAKVIGLKRIIIPEIYRHNARSQNLFLSLGFRLKEQRELSCSYEIEL